MPKNYTGTIEIITTEREARPEETASVQRGDRRITAETVRAKNEIARIVVKADTLPKLVEKLTKHVELVEED